MEDNVRRRRAISAPDFASFPACGDPAAMLTTDLLAERSFPCGARARSTSSRRRANRRPPGPGTPESRERGNASAGEGRIGCAMTRATRIAAAHAAGGRVRSTETATVPHAGTTLPVLFPRSPTSRSLASSEGSSPHEPGQSGRGRQRHDHQHRPTSFGRSTTNHRIFFRRRRRRRNRGSVIGRRGNLDRNRCPPAASEPWRPRTQQERLRHRRHGRCQDPGRAAVSRSGACWCGG